MSVFHNAREQFYDKLLQKDNLPDELARILSINPQESGVFELCQKFEEIALNTRKIRKQGTCEVQGVFQFTDIDKAIYATKAYVRKHHINDVHSFLEIVHDMYPHAVLWDDKRTKSGLVRPEGYDWTSPVAGVYYDFTRIPEDQWRGIIADILKCIQD